MEADERVGTLHRLRAEGLLPRHEADWNRILWAVPRFAVAVTLPLIHQWLHGMREEPCPSLDLCTVLGRTLQQGVPSPHNSGVVPSVGPEVSVAQV